MSASDAAPAFQFTDRSFGGVGLTGVLGLNGFNDSDRSIIFRFKGGVADFKVTYFTGSDTPGGGDPGDPPSTVVPLPAAGWMLLGGLAALGAMRRRD